jgi:GTP-binding protein Era
VPILLVLNKADLLPSDQAADPAEPYRALGKFDHWLLVSALHGDHLDQLLATAIELLPAGPRYYPEEQVTDQQLRFMVAELIREQALRYLRQEIPYSVAVIVDQFKERSADLTYISANIFVERETQKAIILGQGGNMIKRIGRDARKQVESLLGTRVYLELWVKVRKRWRKDEKELQRMGYALSGQR